MYLIQITSKPSGGLIVGFIGTICIMTYVAIDEKHECNARFLFKKNQSSIGANYPFGTVCNLYSVLGENVS